MLGRLVLFMCAWIDGVSRQTASLDAFQCLLLEPTNQLGAPTHIVACTEMRSDPGADCEWRAVADRQMNELGWNGLFPFEWR